MKKIAKLGPAYRGPLSEYKYNNLEVADLLHFLRNVKNPEQVWIGDNLIWPANVPENTYQTYIFGFFGENYDRSYLERVNQELADKCVLILTSTPDLSRFNDLTNLKFFYIEHLHKYLRHYPQQPFVPLHKRQHRFASLSTVSRHHRTLVIAKLLSVDPAALHSFNHKIQSQDCTSEKFYDTMKYIIMSEYVPDTVKPWVDKLLSGELDKTYKSSDALDDWSINIEPYQNAQFHFCAETAYYSSPNNHWQYLTEKSVKCLASATPFIVVGQKKCHTRLADLGFKFPYPETLFDIDHSSDGQRLGVIFKFIDFLSTNLDLDYLQDFAELNYKYLYSEFYDVVEARNAETSKQILNIIESPTLRA